MVASNFIKVVVLGLDFSLQFSTFQFFSILYVLFS